MNCICFLSKGLSGEESERSKCSKKNGMTNATDTTRERKKTMFLTRPKNGSLKRAIIQMKETD